MLNARGTEDHGESIAHSVSGLTRVVGLAYLERAISCVSMNFNFLAISSFMRTNLFQFLLSMAGPSYLSASTFALK